MFLSDNVSSTSSCLDICFTEPHRRGIVCGNDVRKVAENSKQGPLDKRIDTDSCIRMGLRDSFRIGGTVLVLSLGTCQTDAIERCPLQCRFGPVGARSATTARNNIVAHGATPTRAHKCT